MRYLILALVLLQIAVPADAAGKTPAAPAIVDLRTAVTVDDDVIRLGDLFTKTGEQAQTAVAYAPEPGKRATFDARWLYRVAKAYRLNWRPINDRVRAVVSRHSQEISRAEIEDTIRGALIEKGADPEIDIELSNRFLKIHVPGKSLGVIAIDDIHYDDRSKRFTAIITAPANSPHAKRVRVTGKTFMTAEVPVLAHRVLAGDVIRKRDIKWIKVRTRRLQPNTIMHVADLVGKTPRRGLRAGFPVLTNTVRRPVLVKKGSLVTIVLRAPRMLLTAQGKAQEDGSEGDVIRIANSQSRNVIEAEVIGHGKVAARPATLIAMSQ